MPPLSEHPVSVDPEIVHELTVLPATFVTKAVDPEIAIPKGTLNAWGGDGEGGSGEGGGGGDAFGTKSYLLTNFQDRYIVDSVKYGGELLIRDGWSLQSSTARVCRQTSGLLEATSSNSPVAPSPWRIVHISELSSESSRVEFRNKAGPYGGIAHVPLNSELP